MLDLDFILERCKKNDRQAQFQLYDWLAPTLLGLSMRYLQDRDEAEDVMQDSFVKIFTNLGSFKKEGSFEGWAKRITVNTALSTLKLKKKIYFERTLELVETIDIDKENEECLSMDQILDCMSQLPEGYRIVVNLFLVEEFSHKEIAERLGISESTSRSQYARARQALMKLIKEKTKTTSRKNA